MATRGHLKALAVWCQLRKGEILGLQRQDLDLEDEFLCVRRSRTFLTSGQGLLKEPKTIAGRREITIPRNIISHIDEQMRNNVATEPNSFVLAARNGEPISHSAFERAWRKARHSIGRDDLHFHDLRRTGLTLAAVTGATTAELMLRAGHASSDAAIRYQHATRDRDRTLAERLSQMETYELITIA